ncbi:hypothetical protein V8E36_009578 [Tilletia maclaganii]
MLASTRWPPLHSATMLPGAGVDEIMDTHADPSSLPFASLSSSPTPTPHESTGTSSRIAARSHTAFQLPPLSSRAQDRLNQRRLALFKQPTSSTAAASTSSVAAGPSTRWTAHQPSSRLASPSSSSSPGSSRFLFSSSPTLLALAASSSNTHQRRQRDHSNNFSTFLSGTLARAAPANHSTSTSTEVEAEADELAALEMSPSHQRFRLKMREQCEAMRRQLRADRVERGRVRAGTEGATPARGGRTRTIQGLHQARGPGMMVDDDDGGMDDEEWDREDEELIRRTMLLEHRRYMQAGLDTNPDADWQLNPVDAAQLEEEIMFEEQLDQEEREWAALIAEAEAGAASGLGQSQAQAQGRADDDMEI